MHKFNYGPCRKITLAIANTNTTAELREVLKKSVGLPMGYAVVSSRKILSLIESLENGYLSFLEVPTASGLNEKLFSLMLEDCKTSQSLDLLKEQLTPALQDKMFYLDAESDRIVNLMETKTKELSQLSH